MNSSHDQQRRTLALLEATPAWERLCALREDLDLETAASILEAAGALTDEVLYPMDAVADREGCQIVDGRVKVPEVYHAGFAAVVEGGWIGLDLPEELGGSDLPLVLQAASTQIFDRGCTAFNMCTGASRSGAALLAEHAPKEVAAEWVPELIAGRRSTTICISEPGAGSDVGRIRTRAVLEDGVWRITGQKIWISFGDHDLTPLIGHCLLARTSANPGTRGLSLFLVPSRKADGSSNGVTPLRLEHKMGLHGSPTCAMSFEDAEGILIGEVDRGLSQLFTMIERMRLQTGCQGLGMASRSVEIAENYARERLQGGRPDAEPVAIIGHPDVQRQLGVIRGETEILRAAVLELACVMDIAQCAEGEEAKQAAAYTAFLLPLIKNFGSEIAFNVASGGIQVLGGAGYTAEWPLEQSARDARVLAIYEGTTGMQAIDFLERRLMREKEGFEAFLARAAGVENVATAGVIERFAKLGATLQACPDATKRLWAADAWLRCGWLAVTAFVAPRVAKVDADAARFALAQIEQRFAVHEANVLAAIA